MLQTAMMGGMLVGSLVWGLLADRLGRRPTLLLSSLPLLLGGCLPLAAPARPAWYPLLLARCFGPTAVLELAAICIRHR